MSLKKSNDNFDVTNLVGGRLQLEAEKEHLADALRDEATQFKTLNLRRDFLLRVENALKQKIEDAQRNQYQHDAACFCRTGSADADFQLDYLNEQIIKCRNQLENNTNLMSDSRTKLDERARLYERIAAQLAELTKLIHELLG